MNRTISQRHINLSSGNSQASCYRGDVRYVEIANAELKRQWLSTAESDDEDQDPWRVCFFEMEPHRDPEQRSTPADRENVKKKHLLDVLGPGVKKNVPEDTSAYGKYYGVDRVDSDSDSDSEDEGFTLPYGTKILSKFPGHQVVLLPDQTILKFGRGITFNEILALRLAESIGLPVPRLYEQDWEQYYNNHGSRAVSIRMEYIRGKTLLQRWPTMKREQKIKVMQQLCELLAIMRCVFPPSGIIGSCDGSEVRDTRAKHTYFGQVCYDEEQFNEFLVSTIPYAPEFMQAAYRRNLPRNHAIVFCHGDLSPDNIILDRKLNIVGLLDWEDSGWYPEYWEYIKFFTRPPMVPDWQEYASYLFPQRYKKELRDFKCMAPFRMP